MVRPKANECLLRRYDPQFARAASTRRPRVDLPSEMKTAIGKAALNLTRLIWGHPANRGRRVRAVSLFVGWQFYKRLLRRPIDVTERGGLRFKCYPDSQDAGENDLLQPPSGSGGDDFH